MDLPLGYRYAATYAGLRKVEKDDLGLIVSGLPAAAAAVFTQNRVHRSRYFAIGRPTPGVQP